MHDELLEQARRLALLDRRRPKQANLRRAVSAAYYSLFHFLVDESCRGILGRSMSARLIAGSSGGPSTMEQ